MPGKGETCWVNRSPEVFSEAGHGLDVARCKGNAKSPSHCPSMSSRPSVPGTSHSG